MTENRPINLFPIGWVRSTRRHIADDHWESEEVAIELDATQFSPEALTGLEDFSHVVIIFHMHHVQADQIVKGARHPRGNRDYPRTGIFAQRASSRPNALGLTVSRLIKIEKHIILLEGLDAVDGTPVLDIKPWVDEFGPMGRVSRPDWMAKIMADYW